MCTNYEQRRRFESIRHTPTNAIYTPLSNIRQFGAIEQGFKLFIFVVAAMIIIVVSWLSQAVS